MFTLLPSTGASNSGVIAAAVSKHVATWGPTQRAGAATACSLPAGTGFRPLPLSRPSADPPRTPTAQFGHPPAPGLAVAPPRGPPSLSALSAKTTSPLSLNISTT